MFRNRSPRSTKASWTRTLEVDWPWFDWIGLTGNPFLSTSRHCEWSLKSDRIKLSTLFLGNTFELSKRWELQSIWNTRFKGTTNVVRSQSEMSCCVMWLFVVNCYFEFKSLPFLSAWNESSLPIRSTWATKVLRGKTVGSALILSTAKRNMSSCSSSPSLNSPPVVFQIKKRKKEGEG
jgi:hypothetical protein